MTSAPVVVIIGAGIAGLAAAFWLGKAGWRSIVVERAASLRGNGYMLGLSGPGYETAYRMGIRDRLSAAAYEINENVYRDSKGRELLRLRYRDFLRGLPYFAVRRTDLVSILHDVLPPNTELRFSTTATAFHPVSDGVEVELSDSGRIRVDLVVAADGFRSAARNMLFGEDKTHLAPLGYYFAVYDIDDRLNLESDFLSYAEPGHLAEYYALRRGRLAAMHVWRDRCSGLEETKDRWGLLDEVCRTAHPQVRSFLETARKGPPPVIDSLTMVDLPRWSDRRVLLLGDAAHCLTLISGQGAGMALASAEMLAEELSRGLDVDAALNAHEARLRPAIARLQERSRRMAPVFIPESRFAFHTRNIVMRHMPRAWLGRYFTNAVRSEILLASSPQQTAVRNA